MTEVDLRLVSEESGQRGLRIGVDETHTIATQSEPHPECHGRSCLAGTAFEIDGRPNLQLVPGPSARKELKRILGVLRQDAADFQDVLGGVEALVA